MQSNEISVAILMADYGHDPTGKPNNTNNEPTLLTPIFSTETAIPFQTFIKAGFSVTFITENGKSPECDAKMITGWTAKMLGANQAAVDAYNDMIQRPEWKSPLSWSSDEISLESFQLLFLPGGHDKAIRQLLDSSRAQSLVANYWPSIKQPSNKKFCAAICHGVQLLAHTQIDGKSVLHDVSTTALVGTSKQ